MDRLKVAVIQTRSTEDTDENLRRSAELCRAAAADGAKLITLPENVTWLRISATTNVGQPLDSPVIRFYADLAKELEVGILIGSLQEVSEESHRVYNTSILLGPDGQIAASYRKIHLFDIDIPGQVSFRESAHIRPGDEPVVAELFGWKLGLSICYDLRFPELYRALVAKGAEVLLIPAAFTLQTGKDHWEVLMRARAIENQCWLLAPGQWGHHGGVRHSYGHSLIVDPWGHVVAKCSDGEGYATAWMDRAKLQEVRRNLPCGQHRRLS